MKIRDFASTIQFAKVNLDKLDAENYRGFEANFNQIMQQASAYIRNIVRKQYGDKKISDKELNELILEDYFKMLEDTYQSSDIYIITMKYIAVKYLESHREEIPALLSEIEEKKLTCSEKEIYTDNFHQNLLIALIYLRGTFEESEQAIKSGNKIIYQEIMEFTNKYGKEEGFKRYCEKYNSMKSYPLNLRRHYIKNAYYLTFGLEGVNESKKNPSQSSILRYKRTYSIKEFITAYLEILEGVFKEKLKESILSIFQRLDSLGEIKHNVDIHNKRMKAAVLPGLQYFSEEANDEQKYPKVERLINSESFNNLSIETLLRMNSFYNNRFAKVIEDYSRALFVLDNTSSSKSVLDGQTLTSEDLPQEMLHNIILKYQTLILPIRKFFVDSQNNLSKNYSEGRQKIQVKTIKLENGTVQTAVSREEFDACVEENWREEYKAYFDIATPGANNDIREELSLATALYNPVFLSYRFKDQILKSEYAYMFYISEKEKLKSLNYGVVLNELNKGNNILLSSDGETNLPNRLHYKKTEFTDFITSYTGYPLVRVYEGAEDFVVQDRYISTQLLLPIAPVHRKYIRDLRSGKLKSKGDNVSRINYFNKQFIEHIEYCMDSSKFMESHKITRTSVDKKGNTVQKKEQPVRYIDLTTGIIYSLNEEGKLVSKDGKIFGENEGR